MNTTQSAILDDAAIDAVFAPFDTSSGPGVAVGVALHGVPVYRKGFGLANLELPVALSPNMRMRIGSASKHFTSLALMLLAEEGRLSPDDRLSKHLPEMARIAGTVTLRQLMGHISGLRCGLDLIVQVCGLGRVVPADEQLRLMAQQDGVNFQPGQDWCYSNGGYALLSLVIERLTHQPLEEVLAQRIFRPAGMHDTLLRRLDHDFVPNSAALHFRTADGTFVRGVIGPTLAGEGGIVSTVDDMLRWMAHMDNPVIGSAATWAELKRPQLLNNGSTTSYGLGLASGRYRGLDMLYHSGGVLGGACQMLKAPAVGLDVIVMTNAGDVDPMQLANRVIDACVLGLDPVPRECMGDLIEGHYHDPASGRFIELCQSNGQQMVVHDGIRFPLRRSRPGVLEPLFSIFRMSLRVDDEDARQLELQAFGHHYRLQRLEPAPSPLPAADRVFGSAATGSRARFLVDDGLPQLLVHSDLGGNGVLYDMHNVAPLIWRITPIDMAIPILGGYLELDASQRRFRLTTGRTRQLEFVRLR
ncbi:serine hydrolase domain-containing protein [Xanthomonas massiliensis]|uniref:serine hydrolase domain-containing protein n=1 Tax=Xanthomonas massiliensis TaxID=1720302 RepID=UPI000B31A12C|nr:serine hydrolase domain-containing protein [Xanthomonas massiliensis]